MTRIEIIEILKQLDTTEGDFRRQYNVINQFLIKCYANHIEPVLLLNEYFTSVKQPVKHPLHIVKDENLMKYVCPKCPFQTNSSQAYIGHQKKHSPKYSNG